MPQYLTGRYIKQNGKLEFISTVTNKLYDKFIEKLEENQIVEFFYEEQHDDGTLPQLAKLHAMLKTLSMHIGETVENMKLLVKDKAGLCIIREITGKEYFLAKSFGDCSKEELSLAIQATIQIGQDVNCPLH